MANQRDINEIVDRIVKGYDPLAIILFGSQARGTADEDSDVDLIVLKDDFRKPVERNREVRKILFGIMHPVDIFVRTPEKFEGLRNVVGSLPHEASHEGHVVYERGLSESNSCERVDGPGLWYARTINPVCEMCANSAGLSLTRPVSAKFAHSAREEKPSVGHLRLTHRHTETHRTLAFSEWGSRGPAFKSR